MRGVLRFITNRILPFVLLAVLTAVLLQYSFNKITADTEAADVPGISDTDTSDIADVDGEELSAEITPEILPEVQGDTVLSAIAQLKDSADTAAALGYALSDGVYDSEKYALVLATPEDAGALPEDAKYTVELTAEDGTVSQITGFTLCPRMGYINLSDGTSSQILAPYGYVIPYSGEYNLFFAGERDSTGQPVFVDGLSGNYFLLALDGTVTPSDFDPERDTRGIKFDYPSYYGVSDDENIKVINSARGFGYSIEDKTAVNPVYTKAFNYSEGFGCIYDNQNRLYFYNNEGRLRIAGLAVIMYGCGDRTDERSLGYYYFDEGLTRVTKRKFSRGKLVSEYETLIDRKGAEFDIPADYSLYSYSNGRMLLTKNGLSGYMNSRGKWICEPTYTYARPFFEGLAVVGDAYGKKGVIDKNGEYVIPPVFDEITDCSGGVICAYSEQSGWEIIHKTRAPEPEPEPVPEESAEDIG